MIPFHSVLPDIAQREVRCIHLETVAGASPTSRLGAGEYMYVEFYCEDLKCDCHRVFFQVIAAHQPDKILASINYGWEPESFYRARMPYDPQAPRQIVQGVLDPLNIQSEYSPELLELFQLHVADEPYRRRLQRHYQLFREELQRRHASAAQESPVDSAAPARSSPAKKETDRISTAHRNGSTK